MKTSTGLKFYFIYFLLLFICTTSCKYSEVVTTKNGSKAILPVLYISKNNFLHWNSLHNTKIMFRFTYFNGKITLTGWAPTPNDSSDDYDTTDILSLKASKEKQVKLTNQTLYLGNLRLSQLEAASLNNQLISNSNAKYLVFIPRLDSVFTQQVAYKIYLSSSTHSSDTLYTIDPKADPSPPATRK